MLGMSSKTIPSIDPEDLYYGFDEFQIVYAPEIWFPSEHEFLEFDHLCCSGTGRANTREFLVFVVTLTYIWFVKKYSQAAKAKYHRGDLIATRNFTEFYRARLASKTIIDDVFETDFQDIKEAATRTLFQCRIILEENKSIFKNRGMLESRSLIETLIFASRHHSLGQAAPSSFERFLRFVINFVANRDRQTQHFNKDSLYLKPVEKAYHLIRRYKKESGSLVKYRLPVSLSSMDLDRTIIEVSEARES